MAWVDEAPERRSPSRPCMNPHRIRGLSSGQPGQPVLSELGAMLRTINLSTEGQPCTAGFGFYGGGVQPVLVLVSGLVCGSTV